MLRTLTSPQKQAADMKRHGFDLAVMVIQDGWGIAHPSLKEFVAEMFAGPDISQAELAEQLEVTLKGQVTTAVLQRIVPRGGELAEQD